MRHTHIYIVVCMLFLPLLCYAQGMKEKLAHWCVGATVSAAGVRLYGEDKCFSCMQLPDSVFRLMKGRTYRKGCPLRRGELRYLRLLHYDGQGRVRLGEMVCHRAVAADLLKIFRSLYEAHYPIESVLLADRFGGDDLLSMRANNTSCFNYRHVAGSAKVSKHGMGMAVDINPLYNPHVKRRGGKVSVSPPEGRKYASRKGNFPYKIKSGDLCHRLFTEKGFKWGGEWRTSKDYQHFER